MIFPYCRLVSPLPSGILTFYYGKSQFLIGKSTISMAIFNSKPLVYQRVFSLPRTSSCSPVSGICVAWAADRSQKHGKMWGFPWGIPKNGWFIGKIPKWMMNRGTPHFRKPPYGKWGVPGPGGLCWRFIQGCHFTNLWQAVLPVPPCIPMTDPVVWYIC